MIVIEVIGQLTMRLGLFFLATFVAVSLGLMDYILIKEGVSLLGQGLGQFGLEFTIEQVLILISAALVAALLACGSIGIFVWGLLGIFDFD
jgi:hypothetical protein